MGRWVRGIGDFQQIPRKDELAPGLGVPRGQSRSVSVSVLLEYKADVTRGVDASAGKSPATSTAAVRTAYADDAVRRGARDAACVARRGEAVVVGRGTGRRAEGCREARGAGQGFQRDRSAIVDGTESGVQRCQSGQWEGCDEDFLGFFRARWMEGH